MKKLLIAMIAVLTMTAVATENMNAKSIPYRRHEHSGNYGGRVVPTAGWDITNNQPYVGLEVYGYSAFRNAGVAWLYGIYGRYQADWRTNEKGESGFGLMTGFRLTGPKRPIFVDATIKVGVSQQYKIVGAAGEVDGDITGKYLMMLCDNQLLGELVGGIKIGWRPWSRCQVFAEIGERWTPHDGLETDAASTFKAEHNGKPLQYVYKDYRENIQKIDRQFHAWNTYVGLGVIFLF